ncbi:hypothetical protein G6F70_007022 [Rhizopus microsporus]|uniref:Uncharacterized protein n=1 Tax=Rhizopus azygosporus TaxID=86630 RepID=A0A367IZS7_RHIAZ|nr:hypothetical protein G6F71_007424 [Rhizopus microsporus]RCH83079.1 hypothetical protein CU097_003160 [Rhizopus azygosporus]KAG1196963.1 hypothetical protein G6F70_007022 [Rhizopus microsporus]KAG1208183.1 hypothetical protein G6F69_007440 [Rhizopus microsporus]KAG1229403.1 hypothetical protein G6F67_007179 [Rhizopus microsporus]
MADVRKETDSNEEQTKSTIESLKSRIIATNKLYKYLTSAKQDAEEKAKKIASLNNSLEEALKMIDTRDKEYKSLETKYNQLLASSGDDPVELQNKIQSLQQTILTLTQEKQKAESAVSSNTIYIKQLEAQCESLRETSGKKTQGSAKQNAEIKRLQQELMTKTQEVQELKEQLEEEREQKDKVEDELMELQINHEMVNTKQKETNDELQEFKKKYETLDNEFNQLKDAYGKLQTKLIMAEKAATEATAKAEAASHASQPIYNDSSLKEQLQAAKAELKLSKFENEFLRNQIKSMYINQEKNGSQLSDEETTTTTHDLSFSSAASTPVQPSKPIQKRPLVTSQNKSPASSAIPSALPSSLVNSNETSSKTQQALPSPVRKPLLKSTHTKSPVVQPTTKPLSLSQTTTPPTPLTSSTSIPKEQIDKTAYRVTGLIPPPPIIPPTPTKLTTSNSSRSKLEKFANSRNPSKLIGSNPTPVSKKRPSTTVDVSELPEPKKQKQDNKYLKIADQSVNTKYTLPSHIDLSHELESILSEIDACYEKIKSAANPSELSDTTFGIPGGLRISVPGTVDKREKLYAWLLWALVHENTEAYDKMLKALSAIVAERIQSTKPQTTLMRYIRLVSILCKEHGDLSRMRVVCFDIVRYSKCVANTTACLLNVACIYNESISLIGQQQRQPWELQTVICSAVAHMVNASHNKTVKETYSRIVTLCQWSSPHDIVPLQSVISQVAITMKSPDFKELYSKNKAAFKQQTFCIIKSLELAFSTINNWTTIYNDFIRNTLWPMIGDEVLDGLCLELLGVLGSLGVGEGAAGHDKSGVMVLLHKLMSVLKADLSPDMKHLQYSALHGAILLSRNKPEYLKSIQKWLDDNNNKAKK